MKETININSIYDSYNILFSIPVHENQEIINNHVENIFNFNPNCKIILHVNKSFTNFDKNITVYRNLYINSRQHQYIYGKGLLWIHISNFLECIKLGVDFKYFLISSSNEMFVKHGLNNYIETYKNGVQIVEFNINNPWHIFHRGLQNNKEIKNLLSYLNLSKFYGGQTEGQFYEKHVFQKICDIYIQIFGTNEISQFETEEILPQTIFKSMGLEYGLPYTLQNYSNKIKFTEQFIRSLSQASNLSKNITIPNNLIKGNLKAAHANIDTTSIYSIKRVDRNFNNIRNLLTRKGFILNNPLEIYQKNTCYYSHSSILEIFDENHINFKKTINRIKKFQWFGYEIFESQKEYTEDLSGCNTDTPTKDPMSEIGTNNSEVFRKLHQNALSSPESYSRYSIIEDTSQYRRDENMEPLTGSDEYFDITFEIKTKYEIINSEQCGLKISETLYSNFLNDLEINVWKCITIPIYIGVFRKLHLPSVNSGEKQHNIIFIFDEYKDILEIEIKNFSIISSRVFCKISQPLVNPPEIMCNLQQPLLSLSEIESLRIISNKKEDIIISLFSNNYGIINEKGEYEYNYSINSNNIIKNIISPFYDLYNVYILIFLFGDSKTSSKFSNLQKLYNPNKIKYINKPDYYIEQMKEILNFKNNFEIDLKFIIYVNLDCIFEKNISHLPFHIDKFNFLYYTYPLNNDLYEICNSINLFSIPEKYIDIFYNILINNKNNNVKNLYSILYLEIVKNIDKSNIQILIDDIFFDGIDNLYIKNLKNIGNCNNMQGFLFNNNYINELCYTNKYCKFIKSTLSIKKDCLKLEKRRFLNNDISELLVHSVYYFKKKYTENQSSWCWCGLYINNYDETGKDDYADISFDIKLLKNMKKINGSISQDITTFGKSKRNRLKTQDFIQKIELNKDWGLKTHYPLAYYNNWVEKCILNEFVTIQFPVKINHNSQYVIFNFDNYNNEVEFIIKEFKVKLNI
jgi:hypothetical protein